MIRSRALQKSSTFRTSLVLSLEINHDLELIVLYPIEIHFKPSIHNLANDPWLPRNYQCLLNFTKPSLIFFKSTMISNRSYFWNSLQANLAQSRSSEKSLIFNQTSFLEINEHHDSWINPTLLNPIFKNHRQFLDNSNLTFRSWSWIKP